MGSSEFGKGNVRGSTFREDLVQLEPGEGDDISIDLPGLLRGPCPYSVDRKTQKTPWSQYSNLFFLNVLANHLEKIQYSYENEIGKAGNSERGKRREG